MKNFTLLIIVACCAIFPTFLTAQSQDARIVEKRPDLSSPLTKYSDTPFARRQIVRAADPGIAAMVSAINADTLRATLAEMGAWGSRFLMNDNKKTIATSLMNRFLSYGYTDVKLDSFYLIINNWGGLSDSSWQYNVVCTLPGTSAPEEIYVIGGHWDSICLPDPVNDAPGVDDNGTAVAATFEIARVMKQFNLRPKATIQFTLFAAEELGLFGSRVASWTARSTGVDIRYMLNLDMVSNNPDNLPQVKVFQYINQEWAGFLAADATERYTDLEAVIPENKLADASDSYPYWMMNYPVAYFEEIVFSPNWHKPSDTLGNCNVPYLAKVTGAALATIAEQQLLPYPQSLSAQSTKQDVELHWKPTKNDFVKGYNIYRTGNAGGEYAKINPSPVDDSVYHDLLAEPNKQYYYMITTVNDSLYESMFSNVASGARFSFCDTLLVLANVKGSKTTPDSIYNFYKTVLDTIPFVWMDINAGQKANLSTFSRYRSILWMSNSIDFEAITDEMIQGVSEFRENGGNLLYAGFSPGRFWMNTNINYPTKVPEYSLLQQFFKVDTVDRKAQSMMYRAYTVDSGYMNLNVDSLKFMDKGYPGQIYMVDVFAATQSGNLIYRFNTKFDSTNILGKMKHRPVGLEYMGDDYKSILLSFPLYYLDTTDAKDFIHYVMTEKFRNSVGIQQQTCFDPFALKVFPNPVTNECNITFTLDQPGPVKLLLFSQKGDLINTWLDCTLEGGEQQFRFSTTSLMPGLYELALQKSDNISVRKLIRVR